MKLIDVINDYVKLQQSLGMRFGSASRLLRQFSRNMGDIRIEEVEPQAIALFLQGAGPLSATWVLKYSVLSGLYRFAIGSENATAISRMSTAERFQASVAEQKQWREDAPTCKGARSGPFACRRRKLFSS